MTNTYLYILQVDDGSVKVGISGCPKMRCRDLKHQFKLKATPYAQWLLSLEKAQEIEKRAHEALSIKRLRGREWFAVSPQEAEQAIKAIIATYGDAPLSEETSALTRRTGMMGVCLCPERKEIATRAAREDHRSLSNFIECALQEKLQRMGYLDE